MDSTLKIHSFILKLCFSAATVWYSSFTWACTNDYSITQNFTNGAAWTVCWEHRENEGIVYSNVRYKPPQGNEFKVLHSLNLAQIHVPYDDNGARYHDVTDYGIGGKNIEVLAAGECPSGSLHKDYRFTESANKSPLICKQTLSTDHNQAMSLFSVSKVGAYYYIPKYVFYANGNIGLEMGATGALQRYGDNSDHGWALSDNRIGLSHQHNFYWRVDFDLFSTTDNDVIDYVTVEPSNNTVKENVSRITRESKYKIDTTQKPLWRILDGTEKSSSGKTIGYEISNNETRDLRLANSDELFTYYDVYFTLYNKCEMYASRNTIMNGTCTNPKSNLIEFTNNESLTGQDNVMWLRQGFYHIPKSEDAPQMDAHWNRLLMRAINVNNYNSTQTNGGNTTTATTNANSTANTSNASNSSNTANTSSSTSNDDSEVISEGSGGALWLWMLLLMLHRSNRRAVSSITLSGAALLSQSVMANGVTLDSNIRSVINSQTLSKSAAAPNATSKLIKRLKQGAQIENTAMGLEPKTITFHATEQQATLTCPAPIALHTFMHCELISTDSISLADHVDGGMPDHGHGLPSQPLIDTDSDGRILVKGLRFSMPGDWQVRIKSTEKGRAPIVFKFTL